MLHKLLSTFEYEPAKKSEKDDGYFRFEAKPLFTNNGVCLEITLEVPLQSSLFTSAQAAAASQADLSKKKLAELIGMLKSYRLDDSRNFTVDENNKKVTLTAHALRKLARQEGTHGGLLEGATQPYSELNKCFSDDQQQIADELESIANGESVLFGITKQNDDYIISVNNNFCIHNRQDDESRNERSKQFRKTFIETTLRTALIVLISRKLNVRHANIDLKCQRNDQHISVTLKKPDFLKLMNLKPQDLANVVSRISTHQAAPVPAQVQRIQANEFNYAWAYKRLNDEIFQLNLKPVYEDKESLLAIVKDTFSKLNDLDAVCNLYDYIADPERKDFINIHKHPIYDSIFSKGNTSSWQELIHVIREHAFSLLMSKIGQGHISSVAMLNNTDLILSDNLSDTNIKDLNKYKVRSVFSDPRANSFVLRWFNTDTVKAIDKLIGIENSNRYQHVI